MTKRNLNDGEQVISLVSFHHLVIFATGLALGLWDVYNKLYSASKK
ncbi:1349_t:CDS:2 [Rhizophagus irregularis]|nr:1349_t:CDS:2 [Rhizophagus irregularis]